MAIQIIDVVAHVAAKILEAAGHVTYKLYVPLFAMSCVILVEKDQKIFCKKLTKN